MMQFRLALSVTGPTLVPVSDDSPLALAVLVKVVTELQTCTWLSCVISLLSKVTVAAGCQAADPIVIDTERGITE